MSGNIRNMFYSLNEMILVTSVLQTEPGLSYFSKMSYRLCAKKDFFQNNFFTVSLGASMTYSTPLNVLILIDFKPKMSFQIQTEAEKVCSQVAKAQKKGVADCMQIIGLQNIYPSQICS